MTHPASLDPLLLALVEKLPRADAVFTTGDRERWLLAMDSALQLLYPPEWSQDARRKAKEAAAAHFPTVTAPEHGKVTIGVPPDGFEPVLIVPASAAPPPAQPLYAIVHVRKPDGACHAGCPAPGPHHQAERHGSDPHFTGPATGGVFVPIEVDLPEEAPSRTTVEILVDAVDDSGSSAGEPTTTGADDADATSSPETPVDSPPESAPSSPSSGETAPSTPSPASTEITREQAAVIAGVAVEVPAPEQGRKRHFSADQKGAILRRVVREGIAAVAEDTLIHTSTLNRWAREMPIAFKTFTDEWEAEQGPSVEEMEAERQRPIPPRPTQQEAIAKRATELAAKPAVQWPSAPMERRPVDHERTRREQADWA
jgi:hypothetical protein